MARFDRKVERTKKNFEFTQKEKIVETNKDIFKKNFTIKWVQLNIKTVCVFLVGFMFVTLLVIPFMMQFLNATLAFILGHGVITSLVIVFTGFLINKEKKVYQESEKIINYIKNNLVYVGEIDDLLIYETKN